MTMICCLNSRAALPCTDQHPATAEDRENGQALLKTNFVSEHFRWPVSHCPRQSFGRLGIISTDIVHSRRIRLDSEQDRIRFR